MLQNGDVLQLVKVITKLWHLDLQVLALAAPKDQVLEFASFHSVALQVLPVVKDALREGLTTGLLTQSCNETERLSDGKVCLDLKQRSSLTRIFLEPLTATRLHAGIHTTHCILSLVNDNIGTLGL